MSDNSEHVTALIKELLMLNRIESTPTIESPVGEEFERRPANGRGSGRSSCESFIFATDKLFELRFFDMPEGQPEAGFAAVS